MPPADVTGITSDSDLESVLSLQETAAANAISKRRNSVGPKYFCSINGGCGAKFKRLDQLDRHEYHHTGVKKHICLHDDCNKSYSILTHLKRHLRIAHERTTSKSTQKTLPCSVKDCSKLFSTPCSLQRHIREKHEHPKEYACGHCTAKFTQKLKMRRHEIAKHTQSYPYKCDKCGRGFHQGWQHAKHTPSCKVYNCANCKLQFDKWTLYQEHCRETQHGRKYHKCEQCERIFARPSELNKHKIMQHSSEIESNQGSMKFACSEEDCKRTYAYERNLRQHILTAHAGRRFTCTKPGCERCFSSGQNLLKHLARDHDQVEQNVKKAVEPAKPKTKRKQRKDAGSKLQSNLSCLTGLEVDKATDALLRKRDPCALEIITQSLAEEQQQQLEALLDDANI